MANLVKNNGKFSASAEKTIVMGHFGAIRRPPNEAAFVIWLTGALSQKETFPTPGNRLSEGSTRFGRLTGTPTQKPTYARATSRVGTGHKRTEKAPLKRGLYRLLVETVLRRLQLSVAADSLSKEGH